MTALPACIAVHERMRENMNKIMLAVAVFMLLSLGFYLIRKKSVKGGGCCGEQEGPVKRVKVKDRNKAHYPFTVKMHVEGMVCENCARKVENALNILDGVWADVDITTHAATVRSKAPAEEKQLKKAVASAGYYVSEYREL